MLLRNYYLGSCGCKTCNHLIYVAVDARPIYVWHVDDDKWMQYICVLVKNIIETDVMFVHVLLS
jgi:hypothetical protein